MSCRHPMKCARNVRVRVVDGAGVGRNTVPIQSIRRSRVTGGPKRTPDIWLKCRVPKRTEIWCLGCKAAYRVRTRMSGCQKARPIKRTDIPLEMRAQV